MRGTDVTDMKRTYRTAVTGQFPEALTIELRKEIDLRYGENPNQPGQGYCVSKAEDRNNCCDDVPGTRPQKRPRFESPSKEAWVCVPD